MDLSERANMRDREVRTFDVELRAVGEGRMIEGLAAPFNSPTTIRDAYGEYTETIRPGAFARTISERAGKIKLYEQHNRGSFPLANIPMLSESESGLRMAAPIPDTTAGNDALTLVREGIASGLSIGFQVPAGGQEWNEDYTARTITEIKLLEISLVAEPAYANAGVTGIRDINGDDPADVAAAYAALVTRDYTDDHLALVARAHAAFGDVLASLAPTVPMSIQEDIAALFAAMDDAA